MAVLPSSETESPLVFGEVVEPSVLAMLELCRKELYSSLNSSCIEKAQVILDYSWEKLNTGTWRDVDKEWRRVYSYGCLFKAVGTCHGETSQDKVQDAIKTCDLGLLMGASIMDNALQRLIVVLKNKVMVPSEVEDSEQPCPKVTFYEYGSWRFYDPSNFHDDDLSYLLDWTVLRQSYTLTSVFLCQ